MTETANWKGTKLRHADGRTACVVAEYAGPFHRTLYFVDSNGHEEEVTLSAIGDDKGDPGWEWLYSKGESTNWYKLLG
jgi:hypothetical protein